MSSLTNPTEAAALAALQGLILRCGTHSPTNFVTETIAEAAWAYATAWATVRGRHLPPPEPETDDGDSITAMGTLLGPDAAAPELPTRDALVAFVRVVDRMRRIQTLPADRRDKAEEASAACFVDSCLVLLLKHLPPTAEGGGA